MKESTISPTPQVEVEEGVQDAIIIKDDSEDKPLEVKSSIVSLSPMSFTEAIGEMLEGKKIFKLEWKDEEFYGHVKDGMLQLHKKDGQDYRWLLSEVDMLGQDYTVIK